jgi:hypothetical protein
LEKQGLKLAFSGCHVGLASGFVYPYQYRTRQGPLKVKGMARRDLRTLGLF